MQFVVKRPCLLESLLRELPFYLVSGCQTDSDWWEMLTTTAKRAIRLTPAQATSIIPSFPSNEIEIFVHAITQLTIISLGHTAYSATVRRMTYQLGYRNGWLECVDVLTSRKYVLQS